MNWRLAERGGLLVLEAERSAPVEYRLRCIGPAHPSTGQIVEVEVWVPDAQPEERHRFRARPTRPNVRLLESDVVETIGDRPTRARFTSDVGGTAGIGFTVE